MFWYSRNIADGKCIVTKAVKKEPTLDTDNIILFALQHRILIFIGWIVKARKFNLYHRERRSVGNLLKLQDVAGVIGLEDTNESCEMLSIHLQQTQSRESRNKLSKS